MKMRKEMLVAAGALFLAGNASAGFLLFDIDQNESAWRDALRQKGKVAKGGWDFNRDADYGIIGFGGPVTSAGAGPVGAGTIDQDTISMNAPVGNPANNMVGVGPAAGFGNPHNAILANYFTDSLVISFSEKKTAVEFNALSLLGSNRVDLIVNGTTVFAGVAAPAAGHRYGILWDNSGDAINSIQIFDAGGGAEGVQGAGVTYVPAPGALALLGVAGLVSRRRRR